MENSRQSAIGDSSEGALAGWSVVFLVFAIASAVVFVAWMFAAIRAYDEGYSTGEFMVENRKGGPAFVAALYWGVASLTSAIANVFVSVLLRGASDVVRLLRMLVVGARASHISDEEGAEASTG